MKKNQRLFFIINRLLAKPLTVQELIREILDFSGKEFFPKDISGDLKTNEVKIMTRK